MAENYMVKGKSVAELTEKQVPYVAALSPSFKSTVNNMLKEQNLTDPSLREFASRIKGGNEVLAALKTHEDLIKNVSIVVVLNKENVPEYYLRFKGSRYELNKYAEGGDEKAKVLTDMAKAGAPQGTVIASAEFNFKNPDEKTTVRPKGRWA